MQNLVIGFLGVGDQLFDADIFAHDIAGAVQKQQRQEPAHAAVAVVEGVDTEEVQYKNGNQQQRVKLCILHCRFKSIAQCSNGLRCFPCWYRLKPNDLLAVRQFLGNHIVRVFEAAADGLTAVLVQIPMKLQNDRRLWRDKVMTFMNCCKYIAVSGDLFFAAVPGDGLLTNDFFQTFVCCNNALDAVGGFSALYLCNLQEIRQFIRLCLDKKVLLPLVFVNLRQVGHDLRRQELFIFCFEVEISHSISSLDFQFYHISVNDTVIVYRRISSLSTLSLSSFQ